MFCRFGSNVSGEKSEGEALKQKVSREKAIKKMAIKEKTRVRIYFNSRLTIDEAVATYQRPLKKALPDFLINDESSGVAGTGADSNEVRYIEISTVAPGSTRKCLSAIIGALNKIGTPTGSYLVVNQVEAFPVPVGNLEGLIIHCTGNTNNDKESKAIDAQAIASELKSRLSNVARVFGVNEWVCENGKTSIALSVYGKSYQEMASAFDSISPDCILRTLPPSYTVSRQRTPLTMACA